jgi:DNA-binding response OmpR family regulator
VVRVLVVEDDTTVRGAVTEYLTRSGYEVTQAGDGGEALSVFAAEPPDLVLLDLMLPGVDGLEVCRRMRSVRTDLPVIMVTARAQEHERIQGLRQGADDYLTKPFSLRELELRIRSVLRRSRQSADVPTSVRLGDGDLAVDLVAREARRSGESLHLTGREFDLLAWLLRHPDRVWSRDELIREVWGWDVGDVSTVTVHVRRLREKVEQDPARPVRLVTVFGRGYRWVASGTDGGGDGA